MNVYFSLSIDYTGQVSVALATPSFANLLEMDLKIGFLPLSLLSSSSLLILVFLYQFAYVS